eukprot:SAG31_NODE_7561_length_1653_cov_1.485843_1_plen_126_part_01
MPSTDWGSKKQVLAAVAQDGLALVHAAEELRADREIVLAAVAQKGEALQYAAEELRADREVQRVAAGHSARREAARRRRNIGWLISVGEALFLTPSTMVIPTRAPLVVAAVAGDTAVAAKTLAAMT